MIGLNENVCSLHLFLQSYRSIKHAPHRNLKNLHNHNSQTFPSVLQKNFFLFIRWCHQEHVVRRNTTEQNFFRGQTSGSGKSVNNIQSMLFILILMNSIMWAFLSLCFFIISCFALPFGGKKEFQTIIFSLTHILPRDFSPYSTISSCNVGRDERKTFGESRQKEAELRVAEQQMCSDIN